MDLTKRRQLLIWQVLLLLFGTTWLWAPHLNPHLSRATSLISQYEVPNLAYSWVFRAGDLIAGLLVFTAGIFLYDQRRQKLLVGLMFALALGLMLDPLLPTSCVSHGNTCEEFVSLSYILHAMETCLTAVVFFAIAFYDFYLRRRVVSLVFVIFQVLYGILFVTQMASKHDFNTLSQYIYTLTLVGWLAWFVRDYIQPDNFTVGKKELRWVKSAVATWAFISGVAAILVSTLHLSFLTNIHALYFAGGNAWLAEHSVVAGVIMLYLSRHLARGERRARQLFLIILIMEVVKYSVVIPHPVLLAVYSLTFVALFVLRDDFQRGTVPLTWQARITDVYLLAAGLLGSALAILASVDRDNRLVTFTTRAGMHVVHYSTYPYNHLRRILIFQTLSVMMWAGIVAVLWILFRPYNAHEESNHDYEQVVAALRRHSNSSEDYFKRWPEDKTYFWNQAHTGFIAYKRVGSVAFALADPIATHPDQLLKEFLAWAQGLRLKVCFVPVSEESKQLYETQDLNLVQIGSSAIIDVRKFVDDTAKDKWWRWKKNKAIKAGYTFGEALPPHSVDFMGQLRQISDAWLQVGGHEERGFALGYFEENYLQHCRIVYVRDQEGNIVAFANELPQFKPHPVHTIDLMRYLPEYSEAMPFVMYELIQSLAVREAAFFDIGFVPFAKAEGPIVSIAQVFASRRFSWRGLAQFKNKFDPDWQPNYIAYDGDLADLAVVAINLDKAL